MSEPDPDELLTEREAAGILGVSSKTLGCWRFHGRGPIYLRINGAIRYRRSGLFEWIDRNERNLEEEEN